MLASGSGAEDVLVYDAPELFNRLPLYQGACAGDEGIEPVLRRVADDKPSLRQSRGSRRGYSTIRRDTDNARGIRGSTHDAVNARGI